MEVKRDKYSNTVREMSNRIKPNTRESQRGLNLRKMSINVDSKSTKNADKRTPSSKLDFPNRKEPMRDSHSKFRLTNLQFDSSKCYERLSAVAKPTARNEETRKLREIYRLTKQINSKLLSAQNKTDARVQTDPASHVTRNPSNLTTQSIAKEIAVNELFGVKPYVLTGMLDGADSELKRFLLTRLVDQYKLQFVAEEILMELREQGIEVERFVYQAYEQLSVRARAATSNTLITDTELSEQGIGLRLNLNNAD